LILITVDEIGMVGESVIIIGGIIVTHAASEDFRVFGIVAIVALLVPVIISGSAIGVYDALMEVALFNEPFRGCVTR
jgi:hypothetical protein